MRRAECNKEQPANTSRQDKPAHPLADIAVGLVLLVIGAACLPYVWHYSEEVAFAAVRAEDELAFMRVVEQLLSPGLNVEYFKHFNDFGYGSFWWAVITITAAPFKLLGSEQGMVVSIRLVSLVSSLAGFYLAYATVREVAMRRLDLLVGVIALIIACFFTQLVFINSTYIHPETMYCAFLMLAFQQLAKAQGQINRNFYWSLVWLVVAISIKSLAVLFGVVYLVFWWLEPRNIGWRAVVKKAAFIVLATALALNPWVLHPDLLWNALGHIYSQSMVTRTGWPELHFTWTLANSVKYFSDWYVNFSVLLIVLSLALVTGSFLWGRRGQWAEYGQSSRLFFMSAASIVAYAAFCLFYTWQPIHYGIAILYLLPVLLISILGLLPVFRTEHGAAIGWSKHLSGSLAVMFLVGGVYLLQWDKLVGVYNLVTHPEGGPTQMARHRAIYKIRDVLVRYPGTIDLVGVAHDLAVPIINGRRIPFWHLNALPVLRVVESDVLVFWKPDYAYDMKYMKSEPSDPGAYDTYNQIREGIPFSADSNPVAFKKFFEDGELEVYSRTETIKIYSASVSHHHQASRALDGSTAPDDFWEAEGPSPHSITVSLPSDQPVNQYQFSAGELAERMPKAWQLAGSRDGRTWVVLDEHRNESAWKPAETRTYLLKTTASFPHYQFTFSEGHEANILRIYEIRLQ